VKETFKMLVRLPQCIFMKEGLLSGLAPLPPVSCGYVTRSPGQLSS